MSMADHTRRIPQTNSWFTPWHIFMRLGRFDLDPCTAEARPWDTANHHIYETEDGLKAAWFGRVWLNPPYDRRVIHKWMAKMAEHNCGTALVFARTETDFWHRFVWTVAKAVLFIKGRVHFLDHRGVASKNCGGAPSALIA